MSVELVQYGHFTAETYRSLHKDATEADIEKYLELSAKKPRVQAEMAVDIIQNYLEVEGSDPILFQREVVSPVTGEKGLCNFIISPSIRQSLWSLLTIRGELTKMMVDESLLDGVPYFLDKLVEGNHDTI